MEATSEAMEFQPPPTRRRRHHVACNTDVVIPEEKPMEPLSLLPIKPCIKGTVIKGNSWFNQYVSQNDARPDSEKIHDLVVDFLICEGYREAAELLCAESVSDFPETEKTCLHKRYEIRTSIVNGEIDKAITQIKEFVPELLVKNEKVHFQLLRQQLVELIRNKRIDEALEFAQNRLTDLANQPQELLQKLEQTYGLLVFAEPEKSPFGFLLDNNQRNILAAEVNSLICGASNKNPTSKLEQLFRLIVWNKQQVCSHGESISDSDRNNAAQIAKAMFCPDDELHRGIANF